jgi:hypothetical protein
MTYPLSILQKKRPDIGRDAFFMLQKTRINTQDFVLKYQVASQFELVEWAKTRIYWL